MRFTSAYQVYRYWETYTQIFRPRPVPPPPLFLHSIKQTYNISSVILLKFSRTSDIPSNRMFSSERWFFLLHIICNKYQANLFWCLLKDKHYFYMYIAENICKLLFWPWHHVCKTKLKKKMRHPSSSLACLVNMGCQTEALAEPFLTHHCFSGVRNCIYIALELDSSGNGLLRVWVNLKLVSQSV